MNNNISDVCEDVLKQVLMENEQLVDGQLLWIPNGSVLCNMLCNVVRIDDAKVSDEFTLKSRAFVRQPKGDLDISCVNDLDIKIDFNSEGVKEYQKLSKEVKTDDFVDINNELREKEQDEICKMETKSGLVFYAKKPQFLFIYKLMALVARNVDSIYHNRFFDIPHNDVLRDVDCLFEIATEYCDREELLSLITNLGEKSINIEKIGKEDPQKSLTIINNITNYFDLPTNKSVTR